MTVRGSILRRFKRDEGGASALEFAILALPFLAMVFGVAEFGRARWTSAALQEAAQAGARCMGLTLSACSTNGTYDAGATIATVQGYAARWSVTLPASGVALNNAANCGGASGFSQVTLTMPFRTVVPALIPALASGFNLQATSCFPNGAV